MSTMRKLMGRACPLRYRYNLKTVARNEWKEPPPQYDCVYVVGGLYGNALALTALEELVDNDLQQRGINPKRSIIVFNGDFNWFNGVRRESFVSFNQRIMAMVQENKAICIAGNIEAELGASNRQSGSEESRSGCGCAYPDYVSDHIVSNSDQIMLNFVKLTSESTTRNDQKSDNDVSDILQWFSTLPFHAKLRIGGHKENFCLGILHGDPSSLAGWSFAVEAMQPPDLSLHKALGLINHDLSETGERDENGQFKLTDLQYITDSFRDADVDCFASTHTCLPFMQNFLLPSTSSRECDEKIIVNNGSAGMPNFRMDHPTSKREGATTTEGLITRISIPSQADNKTTVVGALPLYGTVVKGVHIDSLPLPFNKQENLELFLRDHPVTSPAHDSYYQRIVSGPNFTLSQANRLT